uniref:Coluporin-15 n=1 Tax=Colubraria reticulata TaxID=604273 RepID=A0A499RJB7_9CAEN|nr:coluporin-15 [Colubraria reticulata]
MVFQFPMLKTVVLILLFIIDVNQADVTYISDGRSVQHDAKNWMWSYKVFAHITVENWTKHPLVRPHLSLNRGRMLHAPSLVLSGKREMFILRKIRDSATGTAGTVSWLVGFTKRRFVLMWSTPFDFTYYSNWMGVGMTTKGHTEKNGRFDQMYYGSNDTILLFNRGEFYYHENPVIYRDDEFEITGRMNKAHKALVTVTFRSVKKTG